jgi:hypothetical protein
MSALAFVMICAIAAFIYKKKQEEKQQQDGYVLMASQENSIR